MFQLEIRKEKHVSPRNSDGNIYGSLCGSVPESDIRCFLSETNTA